MAKKKESDLTVLILIDSRPRPEDTKAFFVKLKGRRQLREFRRILNKESLHKAMAYALFSGTSSAIEKRSRCPHVTLTRNAANWDLIGK